MLSEDELKKDPLYEEALLYTWVFRKVIMQYYKDNLDKQSAIAKL